MEKSTIYEAIGISLSLLNDCDENIVLDKIQHYSCLLDYKFDVLGIKYNEIDYYISLPSMRSHKLFEDLNLDLDFINSVHINGVGMSVRKRSFKSVDTDRHNVCYFIEGFDETKLGSTEQILRKKKILKIRKKKEEDEITKLSIYKRFINFFKFFNS